MRKVWATTERWPFTENVVAAAQIAGASEIIEIPCAALPTLLEGYNEVDDGIAESVRSRRNALLTECDWTQVADAPVDKAAWAVYRQALRDVPDQPGFPDAVIWPTEPA